MRGAAVGPVGPVEGVGSHRGISRGVRGGGRLLQAHRATTTKKGSWRGGHGRGSGLKDTRDPAGSLKGGRPCRLGA